MATFGYGTLGNFYYPGSPDTYLYGGTTNKSCIRGSKFSLPEAGILQSITAWIKWSDKDSQIRFGVYDSNLDKVAETSVYTKGGADAWESIELTIDLTTNPSVDAGDYWLVAIGAHDDFLYIMMANSAGDADQGLYKKPGVTTTDLPNSISGHTLKNFKFSIYCTYTPEGGGGGGNLTLENKSANMAAKMVAAGLI
ncbi:hypothetical protein ES706_04893 [subsurface metagenome]